MLRDRYLTRNQLRNTAVEAVDVDLVLAANSSGSISNDLALQFRGYSEAITSGVFINAVHSDRHRRIALSFVAWSSAGRPDQLVPWMLIGGMSTRQQSATTLPHAPRPIPGFTSLSGATDFARQTLSACRYAADRQVIDVSGNGTNNDGRPVSEARDEAVAAGIAVNGLPIEANQTSRPYYSWNVIGGEAAFVTIARDISSFHTSVLEKFVTEIALPGAQSRSG